MARSWCAVGNPSFVYSRLSPQEKVGVILKMTHDHGQHINTRATCPSFCILSSTRVFCLFEVKPATEGTQQTKGWRWEFEEFCVVPKLLDFFGSGR